MLGRNLYLHQLILGEQRGREPLPVALLVRGEDLVHPLQHLVRRYQHLFDDPVDLVRRRNVVAAEDFVSGVHRCDRSQRPLLVRPVLLVRVDPGADVVLGRELKDLLHEHSHRWRPGTVPYRHRILMGHPDALVVDTQEVLLGDELRRDLREEEAIPLQDLV